MLEKAQLKDCFIFEDSVMPGGMRHGVIFVYSNKENIKILIKEYLLNPLAIYQNCFYGCIANVYTIKDSNLIDFLDLHKIMKVEIDGEDETFDIVSVSNKLNELDSDPFDLQDERVKLILNWEELDKWLSKFTFDKPLKEGESLTRLTFSIDLPVESYLKLADIDEFNHGFVDIENGEDDYTESILIPEI